MMKKCNERRRSITKWVGNKTEREKTLSRIANTRRRIQMYLPCIAFLFVLCFIFFEVYGLEVVKSLGGRKGSRFLIPFSALICYINLDV